jgi:hypothetical protein
MADLNSESCHSLIGFLTPEYLGLGFLKLQVIPRFTCTCISPVPVNWDILTSLLSMFWINIELIDFHTSQKTPRQKHSRSVDLRHNTTLQQMVVCQAVISCIGRKFVSRIDPR